MIQTETASPIKRHHKRNISNSKNEVEEFSSQINNLLNLENN